MYRRKDGRSLLQTDGLLDAKDMCEMAKEALIH